MVLRLMSNQDVSLLALSSDLLLSFGLSELMPSTFYSIFFWKYAHRFVFSAFLKSLSSYRFFNEGAMLKFILVAKLTSNYNLFTYPL